MRGTLLWAVVLAAGCGRAGVERPGDESQSGVRQCSDCATGAYDAKDGFVVHEWGTFTNVVGTDGVLLPGLHHEEEDLPGFMADRIAAATQTPGAMQKMETPVTYFYAPAAMRASAKVRFPGGIFTQWFPWVRDFKPALYFSLDGTEPVDPWLQANVSFPYAACAEKFSGPPKDGLLDWGEFNVLARGESAPLAGPVGESHYRFARNVASNPLQVIGPTREVQHEQFLFYRGLGNFPLPLVASFEGGQPVFFNTNPARALGGLLLMNVTHAGAGFVELGDLAAGTDLRAAVPAADQRLPDFVAALKEKLRARLEADGLYTDEAQAMVDTWERSYFLTPGVRLLYLLPQSETDRLLPLEISPAPRAVLRTMVIRVELLTPEFEQVLRGRLRELALPDSNERARRAFWGDGRFAEPHLRRAMALSTSGAELDAGAQLLGEVALRRRWQPLTAE